jgi:hypothetical protein
MPPQRENAMKDITIESMRAAIQAVVEERGLRYSYQSSDISCYYRAVEGRHDACLFGKVLSEHFDVSDDLLERYEFKAIGDLLYWVGVNDLQLRTACNVVQNAQDGGTPYGFLPDVFERALLTSIV